MPPSHPSPGVSLSPTALSTFKIFPVAICCLLPFPTLRRFLSLRIQTANLFSLRDSVEKSSCHPFPSRLPAAYRTHLPIHIHIFQYVADICPLSSRSSSLSLPSLLVRGVLVHGTSRRPSSCTHDCLPSVTGETLFSRLVTDGRGREGFKHLKVHRSKLS